MPEVVVFGWQEGREFQELISRFDAPAYVRRARQVEGAFEQLIESCRRQREEWLTLVRMRAGRLLALAGDWQNLRTTMADDEQLAVLQIVCDQLRSKLRVPLAETNSSTVLRRAVLSLLKSVHRFNGRWLRFLETLDLEPINHLRDGYNRYYVLEKECALRSSRLAREGFRRLPPLTIHDIAALLPPLPEPRLAGVSL